MLGFILKDQDLVAWYVTEVHILNHIQSRMRTTAGASTRMAVGSSAAEYALISVM